jgi:hypothetical protein
MITTTLINPTPQINPTPSILNPQQCIRHCVEPFEFELNSKGTPHKLCPRCRTLKREWQHNNLDKVNGYGRKSRGNVAKHPYPQRKSFEFTQNIFSPFKEVGINTYFIEMEE